ncbi:MAG: antitoxin [Acidobacteria bacterium]|nr:MAG: antitoxin [Acidobacteriota bacterium]PYU39642.1 MAG: antitoxin [Acidobacteriota bacterium]PYU58317.1 MAG: antitoxin [Acidobacteriota bacterium]PYU70174.1 MAG: antitoxin [Acidobacteriota bacterium]
MYVHYSCEGAVGVSHSRTIRARRINLRATDRQEKLIRTGAETTGLSVTDFILDSACLQAEHVLADKREFVVSPKQWKVFVEALDRPAQTKPELARLFSKTAVLGRGSRK